MGTCEEQTIVSVNSNGVCVQTNATFIVETRGKSCELAFVSGSSLRTCSVVRAVAAAAAAVAFAVAAAAAATTGVS